MTLRWTVVDDTPIGPLTCGVDDLGLCALQFGAQPVPVDVDRRLDVVAEELRAYFAGELVEFTLPVSVRRGSDFERAVWAQLSRIPYGETLTYGEVARAVGQPDAARAVGVACNRNPVAVVVPCHRVVGAGGKLVGFGGGLPRKRHLLELEARVRMEHDWLS
ncbi:methylated-DNA--protein-cysteine methyltransferase [Catellatospora sp. TT07R-123]|uniref:methylated-DNA--[protein]-cysteine S-methyltransferase n=1 Tax=Catellatospora sp. TT07R-123 TaxID=2733863 RepID=UPI001B1793CA|nr:methylated-DNA--[protein]-cysteine S-methyltransferase [Catellatospora sp. TT07R-123]GHJ46004.1 methylated-DNA--protein-cysteine methyltransferase [Catellatospora sp. TT07R-123]